MPRLIPVKTDAQLRELAVLSNEIWHECFPGIISEEQINYMVARFQSYEAMNRQLESEGYQYFFINHEGRNVGYTGYVLKPDERQMFLSKLYLRADCRGQGVASAVIDRLAEICRENPLEKIRLTVNIHNDRAIAVYLHKGFVIAYDQKADIGNGFFMDDHVMELTV